MIKTKKPVKKKGGNDSFNNHFLKKKIDELKRQSAEDDKEIKFLLKDARNWKARAEEAIVEQERLEKERDEDTRHHNLSSEIKALKEEVKFLKHYINDLQQEMWGRTRYDSMNIDKDVKRLLRD